MQLGRSFQASQPLTLGLSGFGSPLSPASLGLEHSDIWRLAILHRLVFRGPGVSSEALKIHFVARSISSSRPKSSALRWALR